MNGAGWLAGLWLRRLDLCAHRQSRAFLRTVLFAAVQFQNKLALPFPSSFKICSASSSPLSLSRLIFRASDFGEQIQSLPFRLQMGII